MATFTLWTLTEICGGVARDPAWVLFWDRASYLGIELAPLAWLVFACQYSGSTEWLTRKVLAAFSFPPLCILLLAWSPWERPWLYRTEYVTLRGPMSYLDVTYNVAFWFNLLYIYMLLMVGLTVLLQAFARTDQLYRRQLFAMIVAMICPWVASVVDVLTDTAGWHYTDLAPLVFPISGLAIFLGIFRYQFFRLTPVARHLVVDEMADGVLVLDAAGHVVDANPVMLGILGKSLRMVLGADLFTAWPAAVALPATDAAESRVEHAAGAQWYDMRRTTLHNWRREEIGQLIVLRDITELKQAEAARDVLEDKLRQAQKMEAIGLLAGGVAHDLNNMLTPILGYAELLQAQCTDTRLAASLQRILDAAGRAADFTKQLLVFSRKQVIDMQVLDLAAMVRDFLPMLQSLVGERITLHAALWPHPVPVEGDQANLQQTLMNLVINARDALPHGGVITVEVTTEEVAETTTRPFPVQPPGRYAVLTVRDTGIGMDAFTQEHLFEPYFTTKERGKGTGLGLATVFGVVKQHLGYIEVESAPERGTTVHIFLPATDAPIVPVIPPTRPGEHAATILLAEDEEGVRTLIQEALETHGYTVLAAADGAEALALAARIPHIDLLLTDLIMPKLNGNELYQRLSADLPALRVLFISGYPDDVIAAHDIDNRTTHFLAKPFPVATLLAKIDGVLTVV